PPETVKASVLQGEAGYATACHGRLKVIGNSLVAILLKPNENLFIFMGPLHPMRYAGMML
ncbi:hypothetical protein LR032_03510, partial [Candidatus Bipolaricaulota bacterium]|nr:hypothetical protein [Candidatus Bipolaricaulota bacterium]